MGKPVYFGLDISDRSVDLVSLIRKQGGIMVDRFGKADIPPGAIDRGVIIDADAVVRVLTALTEAVFAGQKPRHLYAGIALPETQIFSRVFRLPPTLTAQQVEQAVAQEAADTFPLDLRNAETETIVLRRDPKGQDVYFAAVLKKVLQGYVDVAHRAKMTPIFFDSEAVSMARALIRPEDPPTMLADIGARSTTLAIIEGGGVRLTSDIAIAGNHMTQAIEEKLEVPLEEAERLKRTYGFDPGATDDRVFFILQAPMREIITDMRKLLEYYRARNGRAVTRLLLTGGMSLTPFLPEYLSSNLTGVTIERADPLAKVHIDDSAMQKGFHASATVHSASIGLALRAIGVATHPQVTFLAEPPPLYEREFHVSELFKAVGAFISMAKAKRSTASKKPKKHAAKADAPTASVAASTPAPAPAAPAVTAPAAASSPPPVPQAAPAPEPTPAASVTPSRPAATASAVPHIKAFEEQPPSEPEDASDSVLAQLSPAIEAHKEFRESALLGVDGAAAPDTAAPAVSNEQLYAEQLTGRGPTEAREIDEGDLYHVPGTAPAPAAAEEVTVASRPPERRAPRAATLMLVVLVVILGVAAVAGVMFFLRKNDLADGITSRFMGGEAPAAPVEGTTPEMPESVAVTFRLTAGEPAEDAGDAGATPAIGARLLETGGVTKTDTFSTTGLKPSASGKSKGMLTIINDTSTPYTFVATTRFLSSEGVLFRLDKATAIPANGSVKVAVTADVAGPEGDIGPERFTIPGLGPNYEDTVYATSDAPMSGGGGEVAAVSVNDLVGAKDALRALVTADAVADFEALRRETELVNDAMFAEEELGFEAPTVGSEGASFDATLTMNLKTLAIPTDAAATLLADALQAAVPAGADAADYELGSPSYQVVAFDVENFEAMVRVEAPIIRK